MAGWCRGLAKQYLRQMVVAQIKRSVAAVERRSVGARTAVLVGQSLRQRVRNRRGSLENDGGRRHLGKLELEESLRYVEAQFEAYMDGVAAQGGARSVSGLRILEVGPGDTSAVAALFVAAGAAEVVALDRFQPRRDVELDELMCRSAIERLDASAFDLDMPPTASWDELRDRVSYRPGVPLETAPSQGDLGTFDLIVSNAVLEHVYDLEASFTSMDQLLNPGGRMVHLVDLRDHGLYSTRGHHPLTHLTLPGRLYRFVTQPAGAPNRMLSPHYRTLLEQRGYATQLTPTHLLFEDGHSDPSIKRYHDGRISEQMASVRDQLDHEFTSMADADLNTAGVCVIGVKPG